MDTVANCIEELFNQGLYHVCKLWEGFSERNFGGTCLTKCQPTLWVLHRVWLWYPTNSAIYLAESYHSVRQGEDVADSLIMSLISSKRTKRSSPSYQRFLGQDYSGYVSNKCQLWTCLSVHWEGWSLISIQPCQTTVSIILWHAQFIRSWWRN